MKMCRILLCVILFSGCFIHHSDGARILALFQLNVHSHFIMFEALLKGLAAKGHDVVVLSHFPQDKPMANYTDISVKGSLTQLTNSFTLEFAKNQRWMNLLHFIWNLNVDFCARVLEHPEVQKLINSEDKYDLVITEAFGVDCFTAFAHKFKAPQILMTSSVMMPWTDGVFGNPSNPSYIPTFFLPYTDKMDFKQRLLNSVTNVFLKVGSYYFSEMPTQQLVWKHFGNETPPLREISKNYSLVFTNSYFSVNVPRPMVPAVIEVGGLHIGTPKELPKDIETYINEAEFGVIYFSLGSLMRSETFTKEEIDAFLEAFSDLPQRVIWKTDSIPGVPENVLISKWLPQFDILSHPNVKLFITHGGLMGTQEAIYNGVPMVGIPFYSDQHHNIANYVSKGIAVNLDYNNINKKTVLSAVKTVLGNQSYRENAKKMSELFRDRPQTPLETAIFWTEYVIRHRGAPHLRVAACDIPLFQYLLLDVMFVIIAAVTLPCFLLYLLMNKMLTYLRVQKSLKMKSN